MAEKLSARVNAIYALNVHMPFSTLAHGWRARERAMRGVTRVHSQATRLPQVAWSAILPRRPIHLIETDKRNGNVRLAELAVLALAAAAASPGEEIIEIGTFDGRTTINLAINAPDACPVFTLDLPADHPTHFGLDTGERTFIDKPAIGARFQSANPPWADKARKIVQLTGDSATFDWSAHQNKAALVFVDGSHAYDYVRADSRTALGLAAAQAVVLWHDYGVWEGVTRALEELEAAHKLGLCHIRGTSLVCWRHR